MENKAMVTNVYAKSIYDQLCTEEALGIFEK